jgi:hypothetical protein
MTTENTKKELKQEENFQETPPESSISEDLKPEDNELKFTPEALQKRLNRAGKKALNDFLNQSGFKSAEELNQWKEATDKERAEAEKRRREEMSEIEKIKADYEALQIEKQTESERAQQAYIEKEAAEMRAHVTALCTDRGISNIDYAFFQLEKALNECDEDEELDEVTFLDDLVNDEKQKFALGIKSTKRIKPTTSTHDGPEPKPNSSEEPFDATTLSKDEFQTHLEKMRFHGTGH